MSNPVGNGIQVDYDVTYGSPPKTLYELAGDFLEFDLGWGF